MLAIKGLWEFSKIGAEISPPGWSAIIAHAEQREILDMLSSWTVQANRLFELDAPESCWPMQPAGTMPRRRSSAPAPLMG